MLNRIDINEEIRRRVKERMREKGIDPEGETAWSDLARLIDEDYDRIQIGKWMRGDTKTIPAKFIEALDRHGFASAAWLLRGYEGEIGESEIRMSAVRKATTAEIREVRRMLSAIPAPGDHDLADQSREAAERAPREPPGEDPDDPDSG